MSTVLGHTDHWHTVGSVGSSWKPVDGERVVVYGAGGFAREVIRVPAVQRTPTSSMRSIGAEAMCPPIDAVLVHSPGEEPLTRAERADTVAVVGGVQSRCKSRRDRGHARSVRLRYGRRRTRAVRVVRGSVRRAILAWPRRSTLRGSSPTGSRRHHVSGPMMRVANCMRTWFDIESRGRRMPEPCSVQWPSVFPAGCSAHAGADASRSTAARSPVIRSQAFPSSAFRSTPYTRSSRTSRMSPRSRDSRASFRARAAPRSRSGRARLPVTFEHCSFQAAEGEASSLSASGGETVTAVALDDVLPNTLATDLKLDIEGAELDALRGARELISRSHPRLAVCVYHRPEHLWRFRCCSATWARGTTSISGVMGITDSTR